MLAAESLRSDPFILRDSRAAVPTAVNIHYAGEKRARVGRGSRAVVTGVTEDQRLCTRPFLCSLGEMGDLVTESCDFRHCFGWNP